MSSIETEVIKSVIVDRLKRFPLMNRAMMSVTFTDYRSKQLTIALDELVGEGIVIKDEYVVYRATTPLYYLAEEASRLEHYIGTKK